MHKVFRRMIEEALILEEKTKYQDAEQVLYTALQRFEQTQHYHLLSEAERLLGRVLFVQERNNESLRAFLRAFRYAILCNDLTLQLHALSNLSVILLQSGFISLAESCTLTALLSVNSITDIKLKIAIYGNTANALLATGNSTEAEALYLWQIHLIEKHNSYKDTTNAFANIAGTYFTNGNIELAEQWYAEFFRRADAHKNKRLFVKACLNIARILRTKEQVDNALPYIYHALELLKDSPINADKARLYSEAGKTFLSLKDYPKAEKLFKVQLSLANEITDENIANEALNNLSATLLEANDIPQALQYLQHLIHKPHLSKLSSSRAVSLVNLGICYWRLAQPEEAEPYFQQAIQVATSLKNSFLLKNIISAIDSEKNPYR